MFQKTCQRSSRLFLSALHSFPPKTGFRVYNAARWGYIGVRTVTDVSLLLLHSNERCAR